MVATYEKRRRGRPVTTDPAAVGLTALRLFDERGIDRVTMDDVAIEAGISRSNLFRIFPSKAAVIWGGMHEFTEELEKQLKKKSSDSIVKQLHNSWIAAMQVLDQPLETVRLRLKLVASSPEVYGWGQGQLEEARLVLEKAIARVDGEKGVRPKMISSALIAASMAVLTWWATSNDPRSPSEVLDQSFNDFEVIFSQPN
ncbi:TetR family transcriptional regulator [Aquiluna borgnonia]|jgi:AcrR family transcriptional regulator|uniref:TetR family transcriptional regulator n=2 Tax=Aquiluna borgnonia TaxID=2499157 RepID=A0A7D4QNU5_9MICO|nr:TetR family transcriptional regulator [Aquiluna borgnonia]